MKLYLIATTAVLLTGAALSTSASAQGDYSQGYYPQPRYDGYCYVQKQRSGRDGAVVGAVAGGLIGSQVSKNERGLGTVAGAVIGGAIGNSVGRSHVKCHDGDYYSYESGYYDAPVAPDGYDVVYFEQRPSRSSYRNIRTQGPFPPYPHGGYQHGGGPSYDIAARKRYNHRQPYVYGYEIPPPAYYQDGYDRGYTEYYDTQTSYSRHPNHPPMHYDHGHYGQGYDYQGSGYQGGYNYQSQYYSESQSSASSYSRSTRTYVNGVLVNQSGSQSWRGPDGVWHEGPPPAGLFPGAQPY